MSNYVIFRTCDQRNSLIHDMKNNCLKKFDEELFHMALLYHSRPSTPKTIPYYKKDLLIRGHGCSTHKS